MNLKYILIALLLSFNANLYAQTGNCVIFSTTGETFYVALDNKFQNPELNSNIKITDVAEGDYWVTIFFKDENKKAFKSTVRILGGKETSFAIEENAGSFKLQEYSSVPKSQVKTLSTGQTVLPYNSTGVVVNGYKSASEMPDHLVSSQKEINRVQGDRNEKDPNDRRMGQYSSSSSGSTSESTASTDPNSRRMGQHSGTFVEGNTTSTDETKPVEPETGTFTESKYVKSENADGTFKIVEEKTITEKQIVVLNGQRQLKTKKSKIETPTDFTCLPMEKESFVALLNQVTAADVDKRLEVATNGIKGQCMTPGQIKAIGDLILGEVDQNTFAIAAKPLCADQNQFPYNITEPIAVKEEVKEEVVAKEEVVVKEEIKEEVKTKEQLKAELKALKQKEKEEKAAAKQKAKEEKAAAKQKEKEEKAAAKKKKEVK